MTLQFQIRLVVMIVMDMEHAKMANAFAILDTLVYHAIVI